MQHDHDAPVLVTGATGKQGGAVARALSGRRLPTRALVRDPGSTAADALRSLGVDLVQGDLRDPASLAAACDGARAVFSVQMPDMADLGSDLEQVMGRNLVAAARAAGVAQFVHSSVSGAGDYVRASPGYVEGRWDTHYWETKAYVEDQVRAAGFPHWTIIKPAFFMENFVRPSFLFENWMGDRLVTVLRPDTPLSLVAVDDIGAAVAAVVSDPERFDGAEIELAGDRLGMTAIAAVLSDALGLPIEAPSLSPDEAIARGMLPMLVSGQEWLNEVGSPARPEQVRAMGLATTSFAAWAARVLRPAVPAA